MTSVLFCRPEMTGVSVGPGSRELGAQPLTVSAGHRDVGLEQRADSLVVPEAALFDLDTWLVTQYVRPPGSKRWRACCGRCASTWTAGSQVREPDSAAGQHPAQAPLGFRPAVFLHCYGKQDVHSDSAECAQGVGR